MTGQLHFHFLNLKKINYGEEFLCSCPERGKVKAEEWQTPDFDSQAWAWALGRRQGTLRRLKHQEVLLSPWGWPPCGPHSTVTFAPTRVVCPHLSDGFIRGHTSLCRMKQTGRCCLRLCSAETSPEGGYDPVCCCRNQAGQGAQEGWLEDHGGEALTGPFS